MKSWSDHAQRNGCQHSSRDVCSRSRSRCKRAVGSLLRCMLCHTCRSSLPETTHSDFAGFTDITLSSYTQKQVRPITFSCVFPTETVQPWTEVTKEIGTSVHSPSIPVRPSGEELPPISGSVIEHPTKSNEEEISTKEKEREPNTCCGLGRKEKAKERKANRKKDSKGIKTERSGAHKVLKQISNAEREKIAMMEHLKWKKTLLSAMIAKERDLMNTLEEKIQEFSSLVEEKGEKIKSMMVDRKGSLSQKFGPEYHIAKPKLRRKKFSDSLNELRLQREKSSNQMQKYNGKINSTLQLLSEYKTREKTAAPATPAPKLSSSRDRRRIQKKTGQKNAAKEEMKNIKGERKGVNAQKKAEKTLAKEMEKRKLKNIKYSTVIQEQEHYLETLELTIQELSNLIKNRKERIINIKKTKEGELDTNYDIVMSQFRRERLCGHLNNLRIQRKRSSVLIRMYSAKIEDNLYLLSE